VTVVTLQSGAFNLVGEPAGTPTVEKLSAQAAAKVEFIGYEEAEEGGVDLSKAEVIVSAGRGIGKPENLAMVDALAKALGGEYGASRPVVDSGWAEHTRQVGSTGQTVAPKLYVACGISGAIQHLTGMKKSEFIVAINTDRDAPIGEVADVLVVADLKQFLPALTARLEG
jgi:electron transfer flavoprotein alpha subunit